MSDAKTLVRAFYASLARGDAPGALGLLAEDVQWTTMWHYKAAGPGPQGVAEGVLMPLMAEWSSFSLEPAEVLAEGGEVVSLGRFRAMHGTTGRAVEAPYAHVWTVREGRIQRFRQYIDTQAIALARA